MYQPYCVMEDGSQFPFFANGVPVFFMSPNDAEQFCGCHIRELGIEIREIKGDRFELVDTSGID